MRQVRGANESDVKCIGIMQPYFLPYLGYFQLIAHVDQFVIYDNIKYTKKGWINRNRILLNGEPHTISLSLKSDSDFLMIDQRTLAAGFDPQGLLRLLISAYRAASFFEETLPIIRSVLEFPGRNLFDFVFNSISIITKHFNISTPLTISSTLLMDHGLKGQDRVIEICKSCQANSYVNAIGGLELYDPSLFRDAGIDLHFIKSRLSPYPQRGTKFLPALSIIDALFHLGVERTGSLIFNDFDIGTAEEFCGGVSHA